MQEIVGNAQVFLVLRDGKTGKEVGYHIEIADPNLSLEDYEGGLFCDTTISGRCLTREAIDLYEYSLKNRLGGFNESV